MANVQKHQTLEKVLFWTMVFSLGLFVALLIWGLFTNTWLPEEVAFILGAGVFYLMANTLFFGYGHLSDFLDKVANNNLEAHEKALAVQKSGADKRALAEELTEFGIATIWLERYEPYRYAYLGLYLLLSGLVLALNLDLVSGLTTGSILEGFFWGATLVSIFVLAADSIVRWQYAQTVVMPIFQKLEPVLKEPSEAHSVSNENVCPDADDPDCKEETSPSAQKTEENKA